MRIAPLLMAPFLMATLLLAPGAVAQTALIDTPVFQLNDDGGLVSLGTFGTGVIPATGPGARLLWHPAKAAFRAGSAGSAEWDEANVGNYSVAMGQGTRAGGEAATALGYFTTASGHYATALGDQTTASGLQSTAIGVLTTASGDYAIAMGFQTTANSTYATAMGRSATASGTYATALGYFTTASGSRSTAMGAETTAQAYASLVLGRYNTIAGDPNSWVATDPLLVAGNGTSSASRSNALTLLKDGNLTIAGTLTQNSDRRLKRDLQPLSGAVAGLGRLQAVRYRFREGMNRPEGEHIGLVAQEVQAVFPELVSEGADGYLSVSYTNLVAVLVQALNEQQDQVEALRTENAALHERLVRLEAALGKALPSFSVDTR